MVLLGAFLAALATELIGLHALFGAFVAGVAAPWQPEFRAFVRERLEYFSSLFLLPVFFAFTGLRTELGLIQGGGDWLVFALILGLAVAGKFGGAALAARATGVPWRESLALGALMNMRGLMELIVLNIGLELGVFSPKVFSMLVLMALITTFATGPVLAWLGYGRTEQKERAEATA
jgi:Kef-type K+ transport system membrane component KefB